jgi:phosphoribosylformylglycinamidine cyclo-ligase
LGVFSFCQKPFSINVLPNQALFIFEGEVDQMASYEEAGVSLARGDAASEDAKQQISATFTHEIVMDQGIPCTRLKNIFPELQGDPLLSRTVDGVGTKLHYAAVAGRFGTVGRDLVAMVVDDISRYNRRPLGFSMYRSANTIIEEHFHEIIEGAVEGCLEAGVPYTAGETAEMPGFYSGLNFEIVGFSDAVHEFGTLRFGQNTKIGDVLIALPSNGGGSNGFSFFRKIWPVLEVLAGNCPVGIEDILQPTPIYTKQVLEVMVHCPSVRGWAHITGGGLGDRGKLAQILPKGMAALLYKDNWQIPEIFKLAQESSGASDDEMRSTFNMGLMMVAPIEQEEVMKAWAAKGQAFRLPSFLC